MKKISLLVAMVFLTFACNASSNAEDKPMPATRPAITNLSPNPAEPIEKITRTDAEWRKLLTDHQYAILRQQGTEPPFHNEFFDNHEKGDYLCAACGLLLFSSDHKFESGTGWPSFYQPAVKSHVIVNTDPDGSREELSCARCGGHLGHVFDDGPKPTGQRYCIDSASLCFISAPKIPPTTAP